MSDDFFSEENNPPDMRRQPNDPEPVPPWQPADNDKSAPAQSATPAPAHAPSPVATPTPAPSPAPAPRPAAPAPSSPATPSAPATAPAAAPSPSPATAAPAPAPARSPAPAAPAPVPGPSGLDVSDTMVGNFVRSTFKHALTTNTAAHPLQPEKDPLTLSQWSPDQTGSTSMMAIGGRENYAEPTTTTPIPSPAQAPQSSTKPQAQGFGKASEWENKILIDDVTEVSRMTGLVPGSRDIGSMLPRQSNDDESSVFDQIQSQPRTNNEGSDLLRRQERRTGKPASPAKPHPSDYDPSELESLRTGKSSGKDGKKKGGLGAKIVAFFGIILVVGVMGAVGFSFLSKQMPQERPASFTTAAGVTIRNLSGRWAINLVTTLDNGTANPFQQFEATVEQNNQTLSGSGRDGDGNFIITGEIGEDGKRLTLKKQYEGQSRFHLPIMMSGEVADPSTPAVGNGHFYAHISDQSGQQVRVTGEWQAQLSINQPKALF